jgi:hypothetical protein
MTWNVPISRMPHELPNPTRSVLWDIESSGQLENTFINCSNETGALISISPTGHAYYVIEEADMNEHPALLSAAFCN